MRRALVCSLVPTALVLAALAACSDDLKTSSASDAGGAAVDDEQDGSSPPVAEWDAASTAKPKTSCKDEPTRSACTKCCADANKNQVVLEATVACACHGAGTDAGTVSDTDDAGTGPCTSACGATLCAKVRGIPDAPCVACLDANVKTAGSACYAYTRDACAASATCSAELACVSSQCTGK